MLLLTPLLSQLVSSGLSAGAYKKTLLMQRNVLPFYVTAETGAAECPGVKRVENNYDSSSRSRNAMIIFTYSSYVICNLTRQ